MFRGNEKNAVKSKEGPLPADLSVLQTVVPLTSTFLLDHTNCNAGSCEVAG